MQNMIIYVQGNVINIQGLGLDIFYSNFCHGGGVVQSDEFCKPYG